MVFLVVVVVQVIMDILILLASSPDRANYSDDIFGTIGYALDFIIYILSMPFKVLFGAGMDFPISNLVFLG